MSESTATVSTAKGKRGPSKGTKIFGQNKVYTLEWNGNVPHGENRALFSSYCGIIARGKVSITYVDWRAVPESIKHTLWLDIQVSVNL